MLAKFSSIINQISFTKNNESLRNQYESTKPKSKNINFSNKDNDLEKNGTITPPLNQPAAKVLKNSERALN